LTPLAFGTVEEAAAMSCDRSQGGKFRLPWRRLLIAVVYLGLLTGMILPALESLRLGLGLNVPLATLMVSFPLLAILVMLLDRPGPVRNWSVRFLFFMIYPAIALNHDIIVVVDYVKTGHRPTLWATLLLNLVVVACSLRFLRRMVPKVCPGCGKRALLLLMRLGKSDPRTPNTYWCASCGHKVWQDRDGTLRPERRKTWLDAPQGRRAPSREAPATADKSLPPATPHRPPRVGAANEIPAP
jgi:hypothetical protein